MFDVFVLGLTATAVSGLAAGAACHHGWLARAARKKRRIPAQWHLQARPLLLGSEQEVWHWLQRAFFDHHVLVKIPVIRFVSPRNEAEGQRSFELLKSVYCTFTVCAADGTVIGCLDVPGPQGLRASNRDLKRKLFDECGIAYAVVRDSNLPTLEDVRAAFLGEIDLSDDEEGAPAVLGQPPLAMPESEADDVATVPDTMRAADGATLVADAQHVDMTAMAAARSSLQAKLERNRKIRFTNFDPLSTGSGIVHDDGEHHFAVQWEDSFINPEEPQAPKGTKT
ncbi:MULTISPECIES: DUF2726 domain-containing protein [unclassified Polaromonas]|uniref:DUF2726 domain-containing protein n=1 Tax=unclassified Polaromonas TaxID=2638319 RepID=UPI000F097A2F|nr:MULTISPECIES: DUF2726 domain-containing protein [unclassified Polaromonas]AYQ26741.1 DUF2726 domain-containing protein [Polaromonas sp. SP1]QGJ18412.1 DUF2726 domain-containing protein [Polaromonas sp. Pch-P]